MPDPLLAAVRLIRNNEGLRVQGEIGTRCGKAAADFSAIIVNYNGGEMLLAAVRSALGEGIAPDCILVVDNGSIDRSLLQLEAEVPGAVVLRNGCNAGFARAVNQAIRRARTPFLLLLNNDAELSPGALDAFRVAFHGDARLAIAGGRLRYPDGRLQSAYAALPTLLEEVVPMNFLKWAQPERYRRISDTGKSRKVESVFGACLAVRAAALSQIGLLDEEFFFYFEEVEWCRRATMHGWSVGYVPQAQAVHLLGHTANRFRGRARVELQRSKLLFFQKCASPAAYSFLCVFLAVRSGINAFFGLVACVATLFLRGKTRRSTASYLRVFAWHLLGRPAHWGLPGKCAAAAIDAHPSA